MDKKEILAKIKKQQSLALGQLTGQMANTKKCFDFYAAKDSEYRTEIEDTMSPRRRRTRVTINDIQSHVDAINGFIRQNRRIAKFIARLPLNKGQELYSRNMNGIYDYIRESCNSDQIESQQDLDMIVCGYGAIATDITYTVGTSSKMPNGEIKKERISPFCLYWDTSCKEVNLTGAKFVGYYKDYQLEDAMTIFQDDEENNFQSVDEGNGSGNFQFYPPGGTSDKVRYDGMQGSVNFDWADKKEKIVRVYNHQWVEFETYYRARNPILQVESAEIVAAIYAKLQEFAKSEKTVGDTDWDDLFTLDPEGEYLVFPESMLPKMKKEFEEFIDPKKFVRQCYYTAIFSNDHIFTFYKNICQNGFSLKFKTGYYDESSKRYQGLVNSLIEPQLYKNKALDEIMFIIASTSKGGVMYERSAVSDAQTFEKQYARTNAAIAVEDGALSGGKIQPKAQPALPTGIDQIIAISENALNRNGVDASFMGNIKNEDQSGIFYKRLIRQSISKFAAYFDSITMFQKDSALLVADLIRIWVKNNQGEVVRLVSEEGRQDFVELTTDLLAPYYDVDIQEANQTPEDLQETAAMFTTIASQLFTVGQAEKANAFLAESLRLQKIDADARDRLIKKLEANDNQIDPQQVALMQQQLQQLQQIIASGEVEKRKAETQKMTIQAQGEMANAEKTRAETLKILEEAKRTSRETDQIPNATTTSLVI